MGTQRKRILIIDDDPDTVTYLRTWLEDQGYETQEASDGRQGMRAILEHHPDLVLMDLRMPNQTGRQLYKELRGREGLERLPVIVLSGMSEAQLFDDTCEPLPEPVARLDKPPDLQALDAAIRQALG